MKVYWTPTHLSRTLGVIEFFLKANETVECLLAAWAWHTIVSESPSLAWCFCWRGWGGKGEGGSRVARDTCVWIVSLLCTEEEENCDEECREGASWKIEGFKVFPKDSRMDKLKDTLNFLNLCIKFFFQAAIILTEKFGKMYELIW